MGCVDHVPFFLVVPQYGNAVRDPLFPERHGFKIAPGFCKDLSVQFSGGDGNVGMERPCIGPQRITTREVEDGVGAAFDGIQLTVRLQSNKNGAGAERRKIIRPQGKRIAIGQRCRIVQQLLLFFRLHPERRDNCNVRRRLEPHRTTIPVVHVKLVFLYPRIQVRRKNHGYIVHLHNKVVDLRVKE